VIRTFITLIGFLGIASAAAGQDVPSVLLDKAAAAPVDFVAALVEAKVPAGLEVFAGEELFSAKPEVPDDPNSRVALSTVIDAFNGQHRDYTAQLRNGVVVVRPLSSARLFWISRSRFRRPPSREYSPRSGEYWRSSNRR
jgi:hypothetical protein